MGRDFHHIMDVDFRWILEKFRSLILKDVFMQNFA